MCIVGERIPELHWLLRTVPDNDILAMRRQGRMLYDKYFGTIQAILDTTIAVIRDRIGIPPLPVIDTPSPSIFSENFKVSLHYVDIYKYIRLCTLVYCVMKELPGYCLLFA